jgi:hypothetical protein
VPLQSRLVMVLSLPPVVVARPEVISIAWG